jgi:hypothetical protein
MVFKNNYPRDQGETLETQSLRAAEELLGRFKWSLLDPEQLANRAAELVRASENDLSVDHACMQSYSAELYGYISEGGGSGCQLAYHELWSYLLARVERSVDNAPKPSLLKGEMGKRSWTVPFD